jgi:hypothetical protein
MRPLCAALDYAHQSNIVHCDIKPGNILIDQTGLPYLADFGIARIVDSTATQTMAGAGTVQYMPPEQFQGKTPAPTMDIYALGSVLYAMLSGGRRPFDGERAAIQGSISEKYLWEQQHLAPRSLREINSQVPPELEAVVMKCLQKDPQERYQRPMDLLADLESILGRMIAQNQSLAPLGAGGQHNSQPVKSTPISYYPGAAVPQQPVAAPTGTKAPPAGVWAGVVIVAVLIGVLVFGLGIGKPPSVVATATLSAAATLPAYPAVMLASSTAPAPATAAPASSTKTNTPLPKTSTPPPPTGAFTWKKELLDSGPKSGGFVTLAIDSKDVPHLAYLDFNQTFFLHYLQINGGSRPMENISTLKSDGFYNTIRLNSRGNPVVAHYTYYNNTDTDKPLFISVKSPGGYWDTRVVFSRKEMVLGDVGMVLDASDQAHLVYLSRMDRDLWYARPSGSSWTYELIDKGDVFEPTLPDGCALSLQMNPSGQLALAYYDKFVGLKFREASPAKSLAQAVNELPDSNPGAGGFPSLAFDRNGDPHIVYYDLTQGTLKHAVRTGGQWKTEIIERGGVGRCTSLVIDQKNQLHVSYMDAGQSKLKYASGSFGAWTTKILDDASNGVIYSSIALDQAGLPHIAYYLKDPGQVAYLSASRP